MRLLKKKEEKGKEKKAVKGCRMILCEDPITGNMKLFPVKCPKGHIEKMKSRMREKGVQFSEEPLSEDIILNIPEE